MPVAFFAVVSIGVIGLYVAFSIPIFLRWRAGSSFQPGAWNLGTKCKWMAPLAVLEIVITSIIALLPTVDRSARPGDPGFGDWKFVNYTPIVIGGALLLLWICWHLSVKNWFTGPKRPSTCLPGHVLGADRARARPPGVPRRRARPDLTPP